MGMREEFELWVCNADDGLQIEPMWLMRDPNQEGNYGIHEVQTSWKAWQASRAALVVELPEKRVARGYGEQVADALGFNDGVSYCRDAIESAGITVKP